MWYVYNGRTTSVRFLYIYHLKDIENQRQYYEPLWYDLCYITEFTFVATQVILLLARLFSISFKADLPTQYAFHLPLSTCGAGDRKPLRGLLICPPHNFCIDCTVIIIQRMHWKTPCAALSAMQTAGLYGLENGIHE